MIDYKPSPYVTWIKHLADYTSNSEVVSIEHGSTSILVHPGHPALSVQSSEKVYQALDKEDKTVQLYFYSLAWVVPVLQSGSERKIIMSLDIVERVLDISPEEERVGAWNMLWDDHAICERLCVLLEIRKYASLNSLDPDFLNKVDGHTREISLRLNEILKDDKWKNNNHRVFHLLAAFIYADERKDEVRKGELKKSIEGFIDSLIDQDTGFSLEQSLAYCFFDLVVVKNVIATMSQLSAGLKIRANLIEQNLNSHVAALSFPDGSLPASGDTPHGRLLSTHQRKFMPAQDSLVSCWERLDRIGYYRGCADSGRVHFLTLSHNAESAHGHASPLHTDIWFEGFGFLLVDSGGPYKYGSKQRYQWFRASRGHNSLSLKGTNQQELAGLSVAPCGGRSGVQGKAAFKTSSHSRSIFAYDDTLLIHESVTSKDDWEVYYSFSEGSSVKQMGEGVYEVCKSDRHYKIVVRTNIDPSCLEVVQTERCTGHSQSVSAPSLLVLSPSGERDYFLTFSKVSL